MPEIVSYLMKLDVLRVEEGSEELSSQEVRNILTKPKTRNVIIIVGMCFTQVKNNIYILIINENLIRNLETIQETISSMKIPLSSC